MRQPTESYILSILWKDIFGKLHFINVMFSDFDTKTINLTYSIILRSAQCKTKTSDKVTTTVYKFQTTDRVMYVFYILKYFRTIPLERFIFVNFHLVRFWHKIPNFVHHFFLRPGRSHETCQCPLRNAQ